MTEINFQHIRPFNGGKQEAFEELCCQIFHRFYIKKLLNETKYQRFRGSGGDGGVEAIFLLPDSREIGVQAKFFNKLDNSSFNQMEESLNTAIENHPELFLYIFCVPINFTGRRANGRAGTSQIEKVEVWRCAQIEKLKKSGFIIDIEFWTESLLKDKLIEVDPNGGLRFYWFNEQILTKEWVWSRLLEAKDQAGKRYSPELSVEVPAKKILKSFCLPDYWKKQASEIRKEAKGISRGWNIYFQNYRNNDDELINVKNELSFCVSYLSKLPEISVSPEAIQNFSTRAELLLVKLIELEESLYRELLAEHGENADTPSFRQFMAEYQVSFPAAKLDTTRETIKFIRKVKDWINSSQVNLCFSQFMLLEGVAGVGKTHAIVDHAIMQFTYNQFCFIFFGEDFTGSEPWEIMMTKLGLSISTNRDEFWGMLDAAGESQSVPLIIYIDALNESEPRNRWKKTWLPSLRQQLLRYPNIKLCISCRSTYLEEVVDDFQKWPRFTHNGFAGKEYDAIRQFFEFYKLQPPASPLMQSEFSNPLFLHLICQGLKSANMDLLPLGSTGFSDILSLLLEEKNKRISSVCLYDPHEENVTKGLLILAKMMAESNSRSLLYSLAKCAVDQVCSNNDFSKSLFANLEKEGLIAFFERQSRPLGPKERFCRFTFERISDFLIARNLLNGIGEEKLLDAFSQGPLNSLVKSNNVAQENMGLLEAMSIIISEHTDSAQNYELPEIITSVDRNILLKIMFSSFQWRDTKTFSSKTINLIYEGLSSSTTCQVAFEALLEISLSSGNPCNALFLDSVLLTNNLSQRDSYWNYILFNSFNEQKSVWRIVEWALNAELSGFSRDTLKLWSIVLSWFCASTDRRVRDKATKGLVKVCLSCPDVMAFILSKFQDVDDDYILERVSLAVYGAILLGNNETGLSELSKIVLNMIKDGSLPPNAIIRDNLRLIIEEINSKKYLDENIDLSLFRPPYNSPWPLEIPNKEVTDRILQQDSFRRFMELGSNILASDFQRYRLESRILDRFDLKSVNIEYEDIYCWFIKEAETLGYPGPNSQSYNYDRLIVSKYGSGRSKPVWAERIGKKYYWILSRRLQGILSDHVSLKLTRWERDHINKLSLLQGLVLRDIDPSDIRAYIKSKENKSEWWNPTPYNFDLTKNLSHRDWVLRNDLPDIKPSIVFRDPDGTEWVCLLYYVSLNLIMSDGEDEDYPYRDLATLVNSVFIPEKAVASVKRGLKSDEYFDSPGEYSPHDYRIFLGEYPNSITCDQQINTGEIFINCEIPGTEEAQITNIELLRGGEFEYDCSQEDAPNLIVPAPSLINFGELKWDNGNQWISKTGQVQILESRKNSGLMVRKEYLKAYLDSFSMAILFITFQEKRLITKGISNTDVGYNERREIFLFDGEVIKRISHSEHKK